MSAADTMSAEEREILINSLGGGILRRLLSRPGHDRRLQDVLELAEIGVKKLYVSEDSVAPALREFLQSGSSRADYERAKRRMYQLELDLPEQFVDLPSSIEDLLKLDAEMQALGGGPQDVFRDRKNLAALHKGGLAGPHLQKIKAAAVSQYLGVPLAIAEKQSVKDSLKGTAYSQGIGFPEAIKDPKFWADWRKADRGSGGFSWPDLWKKWSKLAKEHDAREQARIDRELDEQMKRYQSALIDRELRRMRFERERRTQKRAKRKPVALLIKPKLEDILIVNYKDWPVITPGGADYFVRIYEDRPNELYRVQDGIPQLVAVDFEYFDGTDPRTGVRGVVPALGRRPMRSRPATPKDVPSGPRGPIGNRR